jgi:hypothetical protein
MGLCGYNEVIGSGITRLIEGMVHAMVTKELAKSDFRRVLDIELDELRVSNDSLARRPEALGYLDGFIAINRFAQVLFERARVQLQDSNDWTCARFESICRRECSALIDAMRDIDSRHRALKASERSGTADSSAIALAISDFIGSCSHEKRTSDLREATA